MQELSDYEKCLPQFSLFVLFQGSHLAWESYKLDNYVQKLAESVFNYQEKVSVCLNQRVNS